MMKATWTKPLAVVEQFMANEYVAACGDSGAEYYFECTAPAGNLYWYEDLSAKNAQPETWPTRTSTNFWGQTTTRTAAELLGSYHPCAAKHKAPTQNPFYWGFVDYDGDKLHDSNETVIVWRGINGKNGHATAELDMSTWETAKS